MFNSGKANKNKCYYTEKQIELESKPCKNTCECNKYQDCKQPCNCNCACKCECHCNKDMREIYDYLGKYVYNLLRELNLPCDHPSLTCSLQKLANGGCLPCGHLSLEQLIVMAIMQEKEEKKCNCDHWVKYK